MIALFTTYLILAYVLIPGVLFRVFAGYLVKLRLFQLSKTQEVTLGVLVSLAPLVFANLFVWKIPVARTYPFPYTYGSVAEYKRAYKIGLGLVVSEDPEKLLNPTGEPNSPYEQAFSAIWHRQLRFLSWYYIFSVTEAVIFGLLARNYGDWVGKSTLYDWLARKVLLPNISEWQLLLTDFTFPKEPKREVQADVLCDGILYRGRVGDYFLDSTGGLSGLLMKDAERFRRKDYETECEKAGGSYSVDREKFWREIPGSNFYIPAEKISNLNVRFPLLDPNLDKDLMTYLDELFKNLDLPSGTTATFEDSKVSASQEPKAPPGNDPNLDDTDPAS